MCLTPYPAINGWAIISEACRVMAKRLRDVYALPESEPLWRAGRGFVVRDLPDNPKGIGSFSPVLCVRTTLGERPKPFHQL